MADAPALFAARSDLEVMRYWDWPAQKAVAEVEAVIASYQVDIDAGTVLWWAVALSPDSPAIGECDLSEIDSHRRHAELDFLFASAHWGKGYAWEAAERMTACGFDTLGFERLWARFHAGNESSRRLLERLSFAYEGTLKRHILRDGERRDCIIIYGRTVRLSVSVHRCDVNFLFLVGDVKMQPP